jgi:predicted adenylyl cyclase CyaB
LKNLELKVKCKDHKQALKSLKLLNAEYAGILKQRDVYFNLSPGRLKLRSININVHQLIYYKRSNRASAKFSNYYISDIIHPKRVEMLLKEIFGIKIIVNKLRKLYIWQNVRIHIDTVSSLGKFIEFEIVCKSLKDEKGSFEKMKYLKNIFNISNNDILRSSYSDMLIRKL